MVQAGTLYSSIQTNHYINTNQISVENIHKMKTKNKLKKIGMYTYTIYLKWKK